MKTKEELIKIMQAEMEVAWLYLDEDIRRRVSYGHEPSFITAKAKITARVSYGQAEINKFLISKLKD
jgi:hypothetical protein